ncbi:MAG: 2,3-cyclic 3-phosphodiesterase [Chloroflexota bacterium]|nr:2,3-cyclic 3-phosphodiesterase [Chloroflexota bacterium]
MAALRSRHPDARWLPPNKLHLTLVFLGQTESRDVQRIAAVTAAVAERHRAYEAVTGNGGGRLSVERGGVCWLSLEEGGHETAQLALDLDADLGSATYDATHPPHPHLTLARGIDRATLDDVRSTARGLTLRWPADRLVLFRSYTDPGGSIYEELAEFPLPGAVD